jgi:flagellar hook-associated protein 3 FlgL
MRISTSQIVSSGIREMLLRQADVQKTQLQIATQKRVLKPSDDPVAITSINFLKTEISQLEQFNRNGDAAKASNELSESVLNGVSNILFKFKELTVQLGNGLYSQSELNSISIEMQENLRELFGLANTQNSNGDYLFSGSQVKTKPFTKDAAGNAIYNGDQTQRLLRVSSGLVTQTSDTGFDIFSNVFNGNGKFTTVSNQGNAGTGLISPGSYEAPPQFLAEPYTISFGTDVNGNTTYTVTGDTSAATIIPATAWDQGQTISFNGINVEVTGEPVAGDEFYIAPSQPQDIFTTIKTAIDAVAATNESPEGRAHFLNVISGVQMSLDKAQDNIDISRGKIGSRLNAIEQESNSNLSLLVVSQSALSDVEDLDMVEASTRFSQQLVVLEAAQASFVRVQDLNLFNFL